MLKAGLAGIGNVNVVTPMADALSAGLVCFQIGGLSAQQVVDRLHARKIIATVTPYKASPIRGWRRDCSTTRAQVSAVLDVVRAIA